MSFSNELREELLELKMWDAGSALKQDEQLARLLVREAFIKNGFINDPNKVYHLEILFKTKEKADTIKEIVNSFGINMKLTMKNKNYMLYLKEGEDISSFLALMGANKAVIKFEEIRVLKETRNNINRLVNCETANLSKTINAAMTQIEDIKYLKEHKKFNDLPSTLQEIANLRIQNPDMSYEELGKLLIKPIGKSGVSHRLEKIRKIAEEARKIK
jgi:DNA-binding protein WhiA